MTTIECDALVVHGNGVTPEGEPNATGIQRADTALTAWERGVAPNIVASGRHSFLLRSPFEVAEATATKRYLVDAGVPESDIFTEDQSLETVGNALFTKVNFVIPNEWERLAVVTSASHVPRLLKIYEHVYGDSFDIQGISAPEQRGPKEYVWELLGSALVKEILRGTRQGDHEAIQERLFDLVPGYANGTFGKVAIRSLTGLLRRG
jgi:uncharacterized SAM-binding protein YcdF (DUF218 family)